jgi:hypothetical protein
MARITTAEIAIVTTGAVGLGTPVLSAFFQLLRDKSAAKRDQRATDLNELRVLLDELTAVVYTHTTQLIELERWMQRSAFSLPNPEKAPETDPTRRELYTLNARLVIRRGRHDQLVKRLGSYLKLTDEAVAEIGSLWSKHEPFDYDDERLDARAHGYWAAYETFVDASKEVVGARPQVTGATTCRWGRRARRA